MAEPIKKQFAESGRSRNMYYKGM